MSLKLYMKADYNDGNYVYSLLDVTNANQEDLDTIVKFANISEKRHGWSDEFIDYYISKGLLTNKEINILRNYLPRIREEFPEYTIETLTILKVTEEINII